MPYVGQSVADLFSEEVRLITSDAARKMAERGGDSVMKLAADRTPVVTGQLKAAWKRTDATQSFSDVGAPGWSCEVFNETSYAKFVEDGTGLWGPQHAKYKITPKKPGGVLRWVGKDGQVRFARYVLHPGSPGVYMLAMAMTATDALVRSGLMESVLEEWARKVEAEAGK